VRAHSRLLVDLLHLASVEDKRLFALATEDKHVRIVKLDTRARLSAHELGVVNLELDPALAPNNHAVLALVLIAIEASLRARVKHGDLQLVAGLGFPVAARHQVDPSLVHDDGGRVDSVDGDGRDREPVIRLRVKALGVLGCCSARGVPSKHEDKSIAHESQRR